jgi:hypothetical protein
MVYFAYNIPPPSSITNIFGNWLKGVQKKDKGRICIGVSVVGLFDNAEMILFLTNRRELTFRRLFAGLDPAMGFSPSEGSAEGYGYWMQSVDDGCAGL